MPSGDEVPPTPEELKVLQKYAGEFNWLATRTRPDLAYFTSLITAITSAMTSINDSAMPGLKSFQPVLIS